MFELHVCQSGEWKRLNTFDARRDAMSASIELERAKRYSGIKILSVAFDEDRMTDTKKLIHMWSEEADRKAKGKELEATHNPVPTRQIVCSSMRTGLCVAWSLAQEILEAASGSVYGVRGPHP